MQVALASGGDGVSGSLGWLNLHPDDRPGGCRGPGYTSGNAPAGAHCEMRRGGATVGGAGSRSVVSLED